MVRLSSGLGVVFLVLFGFANLIVAIVNLAMGSSIGQYLMAGFYFMSCAAWFLMAVFYEERA